MFHSALDRRADYAPVSFGPGEPFPELAGVVLDGDPGSRLFGLFRDLLQRAGYGADRFGTPEWNPLGALVAFFHADPIRTGFSDPSGTRHVHVAAPDVCYSHVGSEAAGQQGGVSSIVPEVGRWMAKLPGGRRGVETAVEQALMRGLATA